MPAFVAGFFLPGFQVARSGTLALPGSVGSLCDQASPVRPNWSRSRRVASAIAMVSSPVFNASSVNCWTDRKPYDSRRPTTNAWWLVSIRRVGGPVPVLQTLMHRLTADQHPCRGLLFRSGNVGVRGNTQIDLPRDNGDDHNDGTDAERSGSDAEVWCHGDTAQNEQEVNEPTRGCSATVSRLRRIDTIRFSAAAALRVRRLAVLRICPVNRSKP